MLAFRKAPCILVSLIALAGVLVTGVLATRRIDQPPRTDDAYLQADLVHLAPEVSSRIVELDVRDNEAVRKGDVLFRIDPEPCQMRVDQARAAVRDLEAKLALTSDQVAAQTSKADSAASGIDTTETQRALAASTLARMEPLLGRGFVTAQQVDQARTAQRTAQLSRLWSRISLVSSYPTTTTKFATSSAEEALTADSRICWCGGAPSTSGTIFRTRPRKRLCGSGARRTRSNSRDLRSRCRYLSVALTEGAGDAGIRSLSITWLHQKREVPIS
jgi:multidrug resistance efflux pump